MIEAIGYRRAAAALLAGVIALACGIALVASGSRAAAQAPPCPADPGWTELSVLPGAGRGTLGIAPSPNEPGVLYASSSRGIYRSADCGQTWELLAEDPSNYHELAADRAGRLYARTFRDNLSVSEDGGMTWTRKGDPSAFTVLSFTVSLAADGLLYADGGPSDRLFRARRGSLLGRSDDYGTTWQILPRGGGLYLADALEPDTVYEGGGPLLMRSVDGGASWAPMASFPDLRSGSFIRAMAMSWDGARFWVGTGGPSALYVSADRGETWEQVPTPRLEPTIRLVLSASPFDPRVVFLLTDGPSQKLWAYREDGAVDGK